MILMYSYVILYIYVGKQRRIGLIGCQLISCCNNTCLFNLWKKIELTHDCIDTLLRLINFNYLLVSHTFRTNKVFTLLYYRFHFLLSHFNSLTILY